MRIQKCSPLVNFKSNITFDIGGSQREGSCKIRYSTSKEDDKIYTASTTVNNLGQTTFEDSEDFINQIVKKVKKVQTNNASNISDMGYPASENKIQSMTVFIPSYTSYDFAYYLPNHKNKEHRPLKDLDFSDIRKKLKAAGVDIAPNMKFTLLQDAMGTGLAMAKRLYDNDMLAKGKYYTACITGGGCGVANIERTDDDYVIIKSTGSGYLSQSMSLQKVSKAGASAPALILNFCRAFGLNDEMVDDIQSCHKAEFVLNCPINYKKDVKTDKLAKLLDETGKFNVETVDNKYHIDIKPEYKKDYDISRRSAIDKYCLALARLAIIKKNEGSNGLIVTGPLAKAINNSAKTYYNRNISEWITGHLLGSFNTYELEKIQKTYDFKVFCDERFAIDDNTECKKFAHKVEFVSPERGNWIKLKIADLEDNSLNY